MKFLRAPLLKNICERMLPDCTIDAPLEWFNAKLLRIRMFLLGDHLIIFNHWNVIMRASRHRMNLINMNLIAKTLKTLKHQ